MRLAAIFDLDGTIADVSHRVHLAKAKNWDKFHEGMADDIPIANMVELTKMYSDKGYAILIFTGRPEKYAPQTWNQLHKWGVPVTQVHMRKFDDISPDRFMKLEMLITIRREGFYPVIAFDDRDGNVEMFRANKIQCLQVAKGEY